MHMFDEPVLRASGVGKIYSRHQSASRERIGRALLRATIGGTDARSSTAMSKEFWSLKDVNLTVKRGEAVGIIGLNGAGKTTLLRILAGQLLPDAGEIEVVGRTASMIDLTAGFQVTASGRENIYLRGAALGRSRAEIDASVDEIIAFTELGDAIDAPVATYSSGMTMRLAFSITVATTPDILFIDEVLAVGDFRFRQKCLARLRAIRDTTSFVMVSHSMGDIKSFCSHVLVLDKGQVVFAGDPDQAITVHEQMKNSESASQALSVDNTLGTQYENSTAISDVQNFWCDAEGNPIEGVRSGAPVHFKCTFRIEHVPHKLALGIPVWSIDRTCVTGFSSSFQNKALEIRNGETTTFQLSIPSLPLNAGSYSSIIGIMDGPEYLYRKENPLLIVTPRYSQTWGTVTVPHNWKKASIK